MRFFRIVMVLIVSAASFAADPRPEFANCDAFFRAFGQNMTASDFAWIRTTRLTKPRIAFIRPDLLRRDFPELSNKSDDEIRRWVLEKFAYVTEFANDNSGIQHSGIPTEPEPSSRAMVPHTYGRAYVVPDPLLDAKGIGVTYVTKNKEGQIVILPNREKFKRGAHHQDGLAKYREGLYEACAGSALNCVVGTRGRNTGANEVYFALDLGARVWGFDEHGHQYADDPAVGIFRQGNTRFYRNSPEEQEKARDEFLYANSLLFWRGLYHGSMNRYNADNGVYIDYGTVTGVPRRLYRMTAMSHVPYGLSDFYGLFGEWSKGQATAKEGNSSPFYDRSWGVFLANLGVGVGMPKDRLLRFVKANEKKLGAKDLHELLQELNADREPEFRSDPTGKTFSKMHLAHITETGERGAEDLVPLTDTTEIYRALMVGAAKPNSSSTDHYYRLLKSATNSPKEETLREMAQRMVDVESILRSEFSGRSHDLAKSANDLGNDRIGEQITRARMHQDTGDAQAEYDREPGEGPANRFLDRYQNRVEAVSPRDTLGREKDARRDVGKLARSGMMPAYLIRVKAGGVDRDLPVMVPTTAMLNSPEYAHIRDNTIGLIWRDTRSAGEQFGHAYIRVGDRIFDLQVSDTKTDDFTRMMRNRFFWGFGMQGREGKAPYYETLFSASPEARAELLRYLEDRAKGRATVAGQVVVPHFDASGKGDTWGDGIIRENCGAFATSCNHERWWTDYPKLKQLVDETGLRSRMDGATVALQSVFDGHARPIGFLTWGGKDSIQNPYSQHEVLGFQGVPHSAQTIQAFPMHSPLAANNDRADEVKNWAMQNGLTGYQATALPAMSKSGESGAPTRRFNFVKLDSDKVSKFNDDIAKKSAVLWWRWEPNGQFGHTWISVGDRMYDQAAGHWGNEGLNDFFKRENERGFDLNGNKTFFVGLQLDMDPKDVEILKSFFEARVNGRKSDGTPIPKPDYDFNQPFVKDQITGGRCGMFATSFANSAWQKLFPELPLERIANQYGFQYMDGSLATLHRTFHKAKGPSNFFVVGPPEHVRREGFDKWELPVDALPSDMRGPMRSAWTTGEKRPY